MNTLRIGMLAALLVGLGCGSDGGGASAGDTGEPPEDAPSSRSDAPFDGAGGGHDSGAPKPTDPGSTTGGGGVAKDVPQCSDCDDGNPCTADKCVGGACTHDPEEGGSCDDGDACTMDDLCASGGCAGTPIDCDDGDPCTRDVCDGATGECVHAPDEAACPEPECPELVDCKDPVCAGEACDDGDTCTRDDVCAEGACSGVQVDCDDGDPCTLDGCDGESGACTSLQSPDLCPEPGCPDAPDCALESCEGVSCDDGDACTVADACASGSCAGEAKACDDDEVCTLDACDSATGECIHDGAARDGEVCSDGDPCTRPDACSSSRRRGRCSTPARSRSPCVPSCPRSGRLPMWRGRQERLRGACPLRSTP